MNDLDIERFYANNAQTEVDFLRAKFGIPAPAKEGPNRLTMVAPVVSEPRTPFMESRIVAAAIYTIGALLIGMCITEVFL